MNDSDVSMILSTEDHRELMQNVAAKSAAQFSLIPPVPSIPSQTTGHDQSQTGEMDADRNLQGFEKSNKIEGEDLALIIYTSGTTGKPKGVVHTHKGILSQVQILANAWEYTSADQFLHCLPLHHIHKCHLIISVRGIWQRWRESYPKDGTKVDNAVTVFTGVPTMYTRLIQGYEAMDPELQDASASAASQLRLMVICLQTPCDKTFDGKYRFDDVLPFPVMQQWETITGHRLLERYGMTEFVMAISNPLRGARKEGTVGKPFPGVQAKILGEDESGDDATGVGELCIKSPSLFKEYWKLPKVTEESFTDDGFFKTGDAVKVDEDGYYIILGRTSADIMKECCVLGLPDRDYGEAVCAIIVPEAETERKREEELKPALSLEELCAWAKEKLAPYKLPTRLILWDSLPRNAMGKVNKKELKKTLAAEAQ
ncbi:hypothetical protein F0562_022927 [Nyssa sinensis]|uniref:4-coumarate--CoA ligase n=1 Tax=Nyssa sinensis TaxID=561372 RepID=A0A5J5BF21_9ASTE|nr:hypothetical protein F0562_022927 [Nyssa sinensis]